jgi:hypothetical protein
MQQLKIVTASQGNIHTFENVKRKILFCNSDIQFNKTCLRKKITPTFAIIKLPGESPAIKLTKKKAQTIRIKEEIRHLYKKKQQLNTQLYKLHLQLANEWGNMWTYIQNTIDTKLSQLTFERHRKHNEKIRRLTKEQTNTPLPTHEFFPRVINNTDIKFTDTEHELLNKGFKYNLHHKRKDWLENLALEAESAINYLPQSDRDYYRRQVSQNLTEIHKQSQHEPNQNTHREKNTINSIKSKLKTHEATITSADKGNSIVILPTVSYNTKIQNFINDNGFNTAKSNPTNSFQNKVRTTINKSTHLIPKDTRWKHINLNPSAPTIKGLIKLHKEDQPIRPVVNWRQAPAYKLAKIFVQKTQSIPITPTTRFASLDITNMYSNIPIKETKTIFRNVLNHNNLDHRSKKELLSWYDIITQQNYFTHKGKIIIQKDGLAMGSPASSLLSEVFLQKLEHTNLPQIAKKLNLIDYFRYVDDILIVYDNQHTNLENITQEFNTMHRNIRLTNETEVNKEIHYLDITITRESDNVRIAIFRKPTHTDTIIPYHSNHPPQHKYAAIKFLYNRLNTYQLHKPEYTQELNIIQNIIHNNQFPIQTYQTNRTHTSTFKDPPSQATDTQQPAKWCTFTYTGRETRTITKLFKHTNLKIALRTNNTIYKHLCNSNPTTPTDIFNRSGVYKLSCQNCNKAYIGQTGRNFRTRYKEHLRAFRHNTHQSKFAKHLHEHGHSFGKIETIMEVVKTQVKGNHLNTIERYHIYRETLNNNQLNEDHTDTSNTIFKTLTLLK